jgi:hypothetical protein
MHKNMPWEDQMKAMNYYARKHHFRFDFVRTVGVLRFAALKAWRLEHP